MCLDACVNAYFNHVPRSLPEAPDLAGRLGQILDGLRDLAAMHAARNWALIPVTLLLSAYLSSVARRFASLAGRFAAGPLRVRPPRPRTATPDPARERGRPKPRVPTRFFWLIDWLGYHAAGRGAQLRHMLAHDPQMAALLAASPQGGRILRPLCRMLGMEPGPDLPPSLFPSRAAKATRHDPATPDAPAAARAPSPQAVSLRSSGDDLHEPNPLSSKHGGPSIVLGDWRAGDQAAPDDTPPALASKSA